MGESKVVIDRVVSSPQLVSLFHASEGLKGQVTLGLVSM